ncbi:hypothetical protein [Alkalilimnicola sp. S0819]|uniref:hypothetical protein n=1 Tax=Alkalilimnicola sp. S0819 TaxID=2613922 RepID=UPI001261DC39|nr:hypothetical protein [Alkalilimnicola sp. S0819]KAB7627850.1 hypothetical protein F3N43_02425 [Alkalilimnicola sp. S0819]MPQ15484.1 hypothetical protein [Alkalilimnicola sp. S0819]
MGDAFWDAYRVGSAETDAYWTRHHANKAIGSANQEVRKANQVIAQYKEMFRQAIAQRNDLYIQRGAWADTARSYAAKMGVPEEVAHNEMKARAHAERQRLGVQKVQTD